MNCGERAAEGVGPYGIIQGAVPRSFDCALTRSAQDDRGAARHTKGVLI